MENNKADAVRIQTSVLNALEKKVLVWLAERQLRWMTSDILTYMGAFGYYPFVLKPVRHPCRKDSLYEEHIQVFHKHTKPHGKNADTFR